MSEYMIFCDDLMIDHFKNETEENAIKEFQKKVEINNESPVFEKMKLVELKPIKAELFVIGE